MKKILPILYTVSIIATFMFIVFISNNMSVTEYRQRVDKGFTIIDDYEVTTVKDSTAPQGIVEEYRWTLTDISKSGDCLMFYTVHQNTDIYIDGELIYSLYPDENNAFGKTTGCNWPVTILYDEDNGKEVCIKLTPVYKTSIGATPTIYLGSKVYIFGDIIAKCFPIFVLSVLAIVIGIVFMGFVLISMRNTEVDKSIFALGVFSFIVGLWKLTDLQVMPIFPFNPLGLSYFAIIALSIMVVPYILFVREHFQKDYKIWDAVCISSIIVTLLVIILQITGVADIRETLWLEHIALILSVITLVVTTIIEAKTAKLQKKLKLILFCIVFLVIGAVTDLVIFYIKGNSGTMLYALLGFLIYIIVMGFSSIMETRRLMEIGMKARQFRTMAFHDQLTGLYNRNFYAEYTDGIDYAKKRYSVIMFDVNNLKKCNDNLGHAKGDELLIDSAKLIESVFKPVGKCCRVGGDEFCVVVQNGYDLDLELLLDNFKRLIKEHNEKFPEHFPVQIAYGYAHYSKEVDYDFSDTLRRADKVMYQRKIKMKAKQGE